MSTFVSTASNDTTPFDDTFTEFNQNAQDCSDIQQQLIDDKKAYRALLDKYGKMKGPPDLIIFLYLSNVFSNIDPEQTATVTGLENTQLEETGKQLSAMASHTKLMDDLQDIMNCTAEGGSATQMANHLDRLLAYLDKDNSPAKNAFDPNILSTLHVNLAALRGTIHTGSGTYDGKIGDANCYFVPGNKDYLQSFQDMHDKMKQPGQDQAQNAAKFCTDTFGTLTTTTQGANAALGQTVTQLKSIITNIQSFMAAMEKDFLDRCKGAVQNEVSR